jgi:hypothetical protein
MEIYCEITKNAGRIKKEIVSSHPSAGTPLFLCVEKKK